MRLWLPLALVVCASSAQSQSATEAPELTQAKKELERIEKLAATGALPRNQIEQARRVVLEAEDRAVLRKTLFGALQVDELTEPVTRQMMESATRLMTVQQARIEEQRKLIEAGVVSRISLSPLIEELDLRRKTMLLAESRVRLWNQLLEMARAEQQRQMEAEQAIAALQNHEDDSVVPSGRVRQLEREYEQTFSRTLPVSARGDTVFHRTLGFNHTGRLDVAVNPDSAEGQWLRRWLDRMSVPYLAFRSAIKGQASAPHIHIGPPSSRLRTTD